MARGSDINQRIVLTGAEEVRRHLEQIGQAGERSGNQVRANLLAATSQLNSFTAGARSAGQSSGQMRFALQNLSFQVNDVATSLASGGDAARVFAQQGGQIFQAFQQGGGFTAVFGAAATAIRGLITPMTALVAATAAVGAGIAFIISRAVSAESATRQFDVILKATGKSGQATGKELEALSQKFRDVGLSGDEARDALQKALREGINPREVEKVVRAGAELNAVFGEGTLDKFISAASAGGAPLEEFARKLGIIPGVADETVKALKAAADEAKKAADAFDDAFRQRSEALADENLNRITQIADLTRKRGTAEEEIELASKRRIEDINRAHVRRINELIRQRNADNARRLAEFNQQTEDAAQKALDKISLVQQILNRVTGSSAAALSPLGQALRDLNVAFNDFVNSLAKSGILTSIVAGFGSMVTAISQLVKGEFSLQALGIVILAALPVFAALRLAALGVAAALGPIGLAAAAVALAVVFLDLSKALAGVTATADGALTLFKAFVGFMRDFFVTAIDTFVIAPIKTLIGWFDALIEKAQEAANALAAVFGGRPQLDLTSPAAQAAFQGFAAGTARTPPGTILVGERGPELISQPGGLSVWPNGLTRQILSAFSSLNMPAMPRSRSFAAGTIGASAGGVGSPVYLTFPSGKTVGPMMADRQVRRAMEREARRDAMLSAGKLPSTA